MAAWRLPCDLGPRSVELHKPVACVISTNAAWQLGARFVSAEHGLQRDAACAHYSQILHVSVSIQVPCLHSELHISCLPVRPVLGGLQDEQLSAAAAMLLKQLATGGVGRRVVEAGATAAACQVFASTAAVQTQLAWLQLLAALAASAATCELVCKQLAQKPAAPTGKGQSPVRVQAATWELALLMQCALESPENSRGGLRHLAQLLLVVRTWCCLQMNLLHLLPAMYPTTRTPQATCSPGS